MLGALYLIGVVKFVIHKPGDDAGFANRLVSEEDLLVTFVSSDRSTRTCTTLQRHVLQIITSLYLAKGETVDPLAIADRCKRPLEYF